MGGGVLNFEKEVLRKVEWLLTTEQQSRGAWYVTHSSF